MSGKRLVLVCILAPIVIVTGCEKYENCSPGFSWCWARCVDLENDHENCGACDNACDSHETCVNGGCVSQCTCSSDQDCPVDACCLEDCVCALKDCTGLECGPDPVCGLSCGECLGCDGETDPALCNNDGTCQEGCTSPCDLPGSVDGSLQVMEITDRTTYSPDVLYHADRFHAYIESVIFGDGAIYLSRSQDGLSWSVPRRLDGELGDPFVLPDGAGYRMWQAIWPKTIALSESEDGENWSVGQVVYEGSGGLFAPDDQELHCPYIWHDGNQYNLYYYGYTSGCHEDMCTGVASIGHATSMDGRDFTFKDWIFVAEPCDPEGIQWSSMMLTAFARPSCDTCQLTHVVLLAHGSLCDDPDWKTYVFISEDGLSFSDPIPLQNPDPIRGTILVGENGGALAYHGSYGDSDAITIEPIDLSALGVDCE